MWGGPTLETRNPLYDAEIRDRLPSHVSSLCKKCLRHKIENYNGNPKALAAKLISVILYNNIYKKDYIKKYIYI